MIDAGTYILVGMREWVDEGAGSKSCEDKNVKYCDLLEVYNSMERDILRRSHGVFSNLKDESVSKYDDRDTNITFVDENTLKYQNMIKNMEEKKGIKKNGSDNSEGSGDDDEDIKEQSTVITTNVKHVGKGVIVQSYAISDDDDDDDDNDDDDNQEDESDDSGVNVNKFVSNINSTANVIINTSKKIVYEVDNNINVDDI